MKAKSIAFENYRNIASLSLALSPGVNVLWGANAQGKSNILEGIYYFARGKSFRGVPDRLLLRTGYDFARMTLVCQADCDCYDTELSAVIARQGRRRLTRGGALLSGVKEMVGSFRAVLFCPEHLSLVSGAPAQRRSFLDIAIAQMLPAYVAALTSYTRALAERNALIRQAAEGARAGREEWSVYAEQLSRTGSYIASVRAAYVSRLDRRVAQCFSDMTGGREKPSLSYVCAAGEVAAPPDGAFSQKNAAAELYRLLTEDVEREIRAGTTLHGIQRDDVEIRLNGECARLYASQGQTRSLALAMKLGEGALSREMGGEEPVYLLDDVFSELDGERRAYLLSALGKRQVIITSCEPDSGAASIPGVALFHVENGCVHEAR